MLDEGLMILFQIAVMERKPQRSRSPDEDRSKRKRETSTGTYVTNSFSVPCFKALIIRLINLPAMIATL